MCTHIIINHASGTELEHPTRAVPVGPRTIKQFVHIFRIASCHSGPQNVSKSKM
jgi:hypothetical protein